jgi:hypothetical protein
MCSLAPEQVIGNMELWEYNEELCEAPFLLLDRFDIYLFDYIHDKMRLDIFINI